MIRNKADVEFHSDRGPARPAINVKCHNASGLCSRVEEHFKCSEEVAERALAWVWNSAVQRFWEDVPEIASETFKDGCVKVWQEGRSGGWLVVEGLPDIEDWSAVNLARWRSFDRQVRKLIDWLSGWEQVKDDIEANRWAEANAEEYNFIDQKDGATVCLADVDRCAHCKGRG